MMRPAMPAIYDLTGLLPIELQLKYAQNRWFHWSWCRLDELTELINQSYRRYRRWDPQELLRRFAIPKEQGKVRATSQDKFWRYDLQLLWVDEKERELLCEPYSLSDIQYVGLEHYARGPYLPTGWVKDVMWAIETRSEHAHRAADGVKVAEFPDGTGYMMISTSSAARSPKKAA